MTIKGRLKNFWHWFWWRRVRGLRFYAVHRFWPEELWDLQYHMTKHILPRLKQFRKNISGTPSIIGYEIYGEQYTEQKDWSEAEKRWAEYIDEMIWAFEFAESDDDMLFDDINKLQLKPEEERKKLQARYENGMQLFAKFYRCLWL